MGAWIETITGTVYPQGSPVAPLVGAWIETSRMIRKFNPRTVAPLVGAWIETQGVGDFLTAYHVAPLVGAWIETVALHPTSVAAVSHPSWVRGLKLVESVCTEYSCSRTPRGCVD